MYWTLLTDMFEVNKNQHDFMLRVRGDVGI